jgi:ABC-type transport system involved in multi-copper enzyme maturation permease subunit
VLTLTVNIGAMTIAYYAMLAYMDWVTDPALKRAWPAPALDPRLAIPIVLILAQLTLVTAIALFFSTFSSPLLSALLTLGLWTAGHFNSDLRNFEQIIDSPVAVYTARAVYYVLPNLAPFDIKGQVVHGGAVDGAHVALTLAYAAVYVGALLAAAVAIFRRRDFK